MQSKFCKLGIVVLSATMMLGIAGCVPPGGGDPVVIEGQVTGGGGLYQEANGSRSTFTLQASSCGAPDIAPSGSFNYIDRTGDAVGLFGKNGVMADGSITAVSVCSADSPAWDPAANNGQGGCTGVGAGQNFCPAGGYLVSFDYRNKNSKYLGGQGTGQGGACVVDNGEGHNATGPDEAGITFISGPFQPYTRVGTFNGNIQGHLCD